MDQNYTCPVAKPSRVPWNKGKLVGAKPPLRPSHGRSGPGIEVDDAIEIAEKIDI